MQVTTTIYRRGVNWKPMPKKCAFLAWTKGGTRVVLRHAHRDIYEVPYDRDRWWLAKEIVAWCYLPKLEAKP